MKSLTIKSWLEKVSMEKVDCRVYMPGRDDGAAETPEKMDALSDTEGIVTMVIYAWNLDSGSISAVLYRWRRRQSRQRQQLEGTLSFDQGKHQMRRRHGGDTEETEGRWFAKTRAEV